MKEEIGQMINIATYTRVTFSLWFAAPLHPNDWTTNPTTLGWISIVSLMISVASIAIGIIVNYWFYHKGKRRKLITYEILAQSPIMSIPSQTQKGKITVSYEDSSGHMEELKDASLLSLKIQNLGNEDVKIWRSDDIDIENMEEPIEFEFEGGKIVALTQVETTPSTEIIQQNNLHAYTDTACSNPKLLGLPRCLLKSNQSIQLSVLMEGSEYEYKQYGKLYNGEIQDIHDVKVRKTLTLKVIRQCLFIGLIALLYSVWQLFPYYSNPSIFLAFFIVLIIMFYIEYLILNFLVKTTMMYVRRKYFHLSS